MGFNFKEFSVKDERSSMKVGTDAVLLGAWADLTGCNRILEIGAGCGVISLMLAQRSQAMICSIDIHHGSVEDARSNFHDSPWSDRLIAREMSLRQFYDSDPGKFDLIVSNPPFFSNSLKSPHHHRNLSRHDDHLGIPELFHYAKLLLSQNGRISLIIPASEIHNTEQQARVHDLPLIRRTEVIMRVGKPISRVMCEFGRIPLPAPALSCLHVRDTENHYTGEYKELTGAFYLHLK